MCAGGDDRALDALYTRHGRSAYGIAYRTVRCSALAEEAVQEGFLSAWRSAGRFDGGRGRARTWLLTLVHRRAVDIVRREEARRTDPLRDDDQRGAAGGWPAEGAGLEVREALAALPPRDREVLVLAYYGGLTQSEIADELREPLGTVKSRTHTALGRLRLALKVA